MEFKDTEDGKVVEDVLAGNRKRIQQFIVDRFITKGKDSTVTQIAKGCDRKEGWVQYNLWNEKEEIIVEGIYWYKHPRGWKKPLVMFGPTREFLARLINKNKS